MSFSSGVFSINTAGQPVVTGTTITSTAFNLLTADLATGLSTCILKDGTQTATAGIPFYAGTVALPGIYFGSDTATGLYRIGLNNTGYTINGTKLLDLSSALVAVTGAVTISTTLSVTGHVTLEGVTSTGATGTGNLVFSASPTFTGTVTGSTINATNFNGIIGGTTPAAGAFTTLSVGTTPATAGTIRLPNGAQAIQFRNAANSANVPVIGLDTNNDLEIQLGSGGKARFFTQGYGAEPLQITATGLAVTGTMSATGNITLGTTTGNPFMQNSAGTAASPSFSFYSNADLGMYRSAADTLAWATGGTKRLELSSTGLAVTGALSATSFFETTEIAAPAAGAANTARIFAVDNGSGKTILKVQFATGAAQTIATEP